MYKINFHMGHVRYMDFGYIGGSVIPSYIYEFQDVGGHNRMHPRLSTHYFKKFDCSPTDVNNS